MGVSVYSECDTRKYFSISRIDLKAMRDAGLNITAKELKEKARKSVPYAEIYTGQSKTMGFRQKTKIYRYIDFKEVKQGGIS